MSALIRAVVFFLSVFSGSLVGSGIVQLFTSHVKAGLALSGVGAGVALLAILLVSVTDRGGAQ